MTDKRLTPVNDWIVADWLADRYPDRQPVAPTRNYVSAPVADLSCTLGGARDRQVIYGEAFDLLDRRDGQAFGLAIGADYVGWVLETALRPADTRGKPLDWVSSRMTHAYTRADFKSPERCLLSAGSLVAIGAQEGRFTETELGWVPTAHLASANTDDPAQVAEMFLGTPYLWGGNSALGIDCSGLIKIALTLCGQTCPGDTDLQEKALGRTLSNELPERGDLYFWKGHVAMATDADTLIHANVHHMAVAYEPIHEAIARIQDQGDGPVTRRARLA